MSVKHPMHTFPMIWHFFRVVWLHLFHCWYLTCLYLKSQIIALYFQFPCLNLQLGITPLSQNHYIKIVIIFLVKKSSFWLYWYFLTPIVKVILTQNISLLPLLSPYVSNKWPIFLLFLIPLSSSSFHLLLLY